MKENAMKASGKHRAGTKDIIAELHAHRQTPAYAKYLEQCSLIQKKFALEGQDLAGGHGGIFGRDTEDRYGHDEVHRNAHGQFVLVSRRGAQGVPFYDHASARTVTQPELVRWLFENVISDVLPEALAEMFQPTVEAAYQEA
jgi:hypothetical protein